MKPILCQVRDNRQCNIFVTARSRQTEEVERSTFRLCAVVSWATTSCGCYRRDLLIARNRRRGSTY